MSKSVMRALRLKAYRWMLLPTAAILLTAGILLLFGQFAWSYSLLAGGVIWALPALYFAYKAFPNQIAKLSPQQLVRTFLRAEITKLLLSSLLFILFIKYLNAALGGIISGYLLAQLTYWIWPFIESTLQNNDSS